MGKKYLDTKEGSLEQSVLGVWQTAIEEGEARVDGRTKQYKEHRAKLEAARLRKEKLTKKQKQLDVDGDGEIEGSDLAKLRKKAKKEELDLKEGKVELPDHDKGDPDFIKLIKKLGLKAKTATVMGDDGTVVTGKPDAIEKMLNTMYGNDWKDMYKRKGQNFIDIDEKVQVKEGKMSQLHQLMKDGKTAEEIAKIMRVDAKTIKKLMAGYHESYEFGTDEYRKHTEDVTPGEDGEWVAAQKSKNDSMREALAKVWGVDEGKSPFKKESKKDLTKEVKDGKTMTGKKIASVDINPTIKEKKK